jgi:hypothetical protein
MFCLYFPFISVSFSILYSVFGPKSNGMLLCFLYSCNLFPVPISESVFDTIGLLNKYSQSIYSQGLNDCGLRWMWLSGTAWNYRSDWTNITVWVCTICDPLRFLAEGTLAPQGKLLWWLHRYKDNNWKYLRPLRLKVEIVTLSLFSHARDHKDPSLSTNSICREAYTTFNKITVNIYAERNQGQKFNLLHFGNSKYPQLPPYK